VRFVPISVQTPGLEPLSSGIIAGPCRLQLQCPTQGASLTFRTGDGDGDRDGEKGWQLYTEPIDLPPGDTTVHARAVRIGYLDSPESVAEFTVTPALSQ